MVEFKLVTIDNFHIIVPKYIEDNKIIISEYEDVTNLILSLMKARYFFNFDKTILRGFMEDLTYSYSPNDDLNKDRVLGMLESSDDEDEIDMDELYASMKNSQDEQRVEEVSE